MTEVKIKVGDVVFDGSSYGIVRQGGVPFIEWKTRVTHEGGRIKDSGEVPLSEYMELCDLKVIKDRRILEEIL